MLLREVATGQEDIKLAYQMGYPRVLLLEWFIKGVVNALVGAGDSQSDLLARAYLYQAAVVVKMLWRECNEYRRREHERDCSGGN